jgi:Holliday junction resolvasome RuvABC endonuclease subunit
MKKYIWAFDISLSNTGLSIFTDDGKCVFVISIDTNKINGRIGKLKYIGDMILQIRENYPPKFVLSEKGFYRYNISTEAIFEVHGMVKYLMSDVDYLEIPASTIKKTVSGSGNSKKEVVSEIVKKVYPEVDFTDLDQTDSVAVFLCWLYKTRR